MRTKSDFFVRLCAGASMALFIFSGLASCESEAPKSKNDDDATVGECEPGEIDCIGTTARHCNSDGEWEEEVCDSACVVGEGCVACVEGRNYCVDAGTVGVCTGGEVVPHHECDETTICIMGECVSKCDPQVLEPSNEGCEFWAVDLDNEATDMGFGGNDAAAQQFAVAVANVNDYAVQVKVYKNVADFGLPISEVEVRTVDVQPMSLERIDLPQREVDGCMGQNGDYVKYSGSGTFVSSHAYRIESNGPVVAYQFNPIIQQFSNDASILIPTQALGKHHYVLGWPTANPCGDPQFSDESIPDRTAITIVGVHENTHVTVYPTHKVTASGGDSGLDIPETEPGMPIEFEIGPYDVVNLESWQPIASIQECMSMLEYDGDFTGTRVEASQPVAVFTSLERGIGFGGAEPEPSPNWEGDLCCTDHLEQQLFPVEALGWKFVITRSPVRSTDPSWQEPDIYRIVATENGTTVTTSLADFPEFNLDAGEYATFHSDHGFTIESQGGAIIVGQILVSQQYIPDGYIGDPTMVIFPPAEQHRLTYVFLVPPTFQDNYVTLAVPSTGTIELDGETPGEFNAMCDMVEIGMLDTTLYYQWTCPLEEGVHTVHATEPSGLAVYGYYNVGSYGYPGGSDVNIINPVE